MTDTDPASWTDLVSEPVHTHDDERLGEVEAVNRNFLVVKKGLINLRRFYIPLTKVQGWDGNTVWLKVTEKEAEERYKNDRRPDPHFYHFSSAQPPEPTNFVRDFQINMPKMDRVDVDEEPFFAAQDRAAQEPTVLVCPLCDQKFQSKTELDDHVSGKH